MAKNQRLIIFVAIGALMVSILGTSILLLATDGGSNTQNSANDSSSEQVAEIERQLAEQQALAEAQAQQDLAQASCGQLPEQTPVDKAVPDFSLPEGDVTELSTTDLTEGSGKEVKADDCIVAYYHGVLTDGAVFDSAYERGAPNRFSLTQVIEGWTQAIPGMKEGGVRVLTIPSELAYGETGAAPLIGANADLVFVVELVEVVEL